MKINNILKKISIKKASNNHRVEYITDDSRLCRNNSVFIACQGVRNNGRNFINEAILNGAKTIITDSQVLELPNINYIICDNPKRILALMLKVFYRDVSKRINLIGIIGSNGKTSISTLGYEFFNYIGKNSMLIGSNGIHYQSEIIRIDNTTPSITVIYEYLVRAKMLGIKYVFIEVSSIAISELRCLGLEFKCLIFSNFSEDHLDYHKNLENYFYTKLVPFLKLNSKSYAIINKDDIKSKEIIKYLDSRIITYGINNGQFNCEIIKDDLDGMDFLYDNQLYSTNLIGKFNIYNILSIFPICKIFKIKYHLYKKFLVKYKRIKGRMNLIQFDNKNVLIDYAHTEYAVSNVVKQMLEYKKNNIWVILGCGGNRERQKRFHIGTFLNNIDANVILTSDNPRYEDPKEIINDIKSQIKRDIKVIIDRKEAIIYALNKLEKDDILLILGKGCEDYIDISGVKYHYSDMEVCYDWIKNH